MIYNKPRRYQADPRVMTRRKARDSNQSESTSQTHEFPACPSSGGRTARSSAMGGAEWRGRRCTPPGVVRGARAAAGL